MPSTLIRARGVATFLMLSAVVLALPALGDTKERRALKRADRQMSGVVASVDRANGVFTVRLDGGDMFSAPVEKVRVRDVQKNAQDQIATDASGKRQQPRERRLTSDLSSVTVGSRVLVRRKLDRDGNLKRVTVRILER